MSRLPEISYAKFPTTMPSTGKTVFFRPYNVNEEKNLLIAEESKDPIMIMRAIRDIVHNCTDTEDRISVFDAEYLLMHIRSKSVNGVAEFTIKDKDSQEQVKIEIDVTAMKIVKDEKHTNRIDVDETTAIIMQYPTMDSMINSLETETKTSTEINLQNMINCIGSIVDKTTDEVFYATDFSQKELVEWFGKLPKPALQEITRFFNTMPFVRYEIDYKLKNGTPKKLVLEGYQAFFK